jgi:acyl carrier protein
MDKQEIFEIVINQVNELKDTLPDDQQFEVNKDTVLFGNNSKIDSLSLVSVIVDLEGLFSSEYDFDISLTDDRAMTREVSPFDNVVSLVDYIHEIINETSKN